MAGGPAVQVAGARELRAALKRMGESASDLKTIHLAAAMLVANAARGKAPVRSGRLAASVSPRATKTRGTVVAGSRLVPYAGPIHFGWPRRNIEAQPFLFEGLADERSNVVDLYEREVGNLVSRLDRETP